MENTNELFIYVPAAVILVVFLIGIIKDAKDCMKQLRAIEDDHRSSKPEHSK
jgi:hypothetical protein